MGTIVLMAVFGLAVIAGIAVNRLGGHGSQGRKAGLIITGVALVAFGLTTLVSSFTYVGSSDTKIINILGKQHGDIGPGPHFIAPWATTATWDHARQQVQFTGGNCLVVHIQHQQTMCIDLTVWVQDIPSGADAQFRLYRTFGRMMSAFTQRTIITGFFDRVYASYDPVQAKLTAAASGSPAAAPQVRVPTIFELSQQVKALMAKADKGQLRILSVNVGNPAFDKQVQNALNNITTAVAGTDIAQQGVATATYQATANEKLRASGITPAIVQQNCVNSTITAAEHGVTFDQFWNCFGAPGVSAASGSGDGQ